VTAPAVRWIFAQRLAGRSVAGIARELNDHNVPCPSSAEPGRNKHRGGESWMVTTVAAILANPRYTGRQVWNRQLTDHDTAPPDHDPLHPRRPPRRPIIRTGRILLDLTTRAATDPAAIGAYL
jgi:hypothetical protein